MSEMVNRAAQAASDAVLKNHQILMDNVAHTIARAVIEALREPTAEMFDHAKPHMDSWSSNTAWWQAMIDEALR